MRTLLVALPGLVLAGIGLTHPHHLDASTAQWWRDMHVILAVIFPLLGAAQWVLLDDTPKYVRYPGRVLAFGFVVFYGALDALAGIGGGAMTLANGGRTSADEPLFKIGNQLGTVGAWCFLAASAALVVCALLKYKLKALPGAVFLLLGSYLFLSSHIYWPKGVIACTCIAIGLAAISYASASGRSVIEDSTRT
ncbi:hypothetical protein [Lentzea flaviverrucosa]|uniref:Uncharacterized protein n=1 Tax=Lentzea flaviverrucosa TaxID=200379 RepID=A0A1H9Q8H6_9PSEU|nr:hypothetical protein [Lentzea flaviverrucosa]RDI29596.1 hypothetical protein DFR72_10513 [Lentzea flaviverrucosa]SER56717.1 hypothetical protein SAMN05216195_105560 [Lentzea flaviverrucosa]